MLGFARERQAARERVHRAFALRAEWFATSDGSGPGVPVSVRVRNKVNQAGDLGSAGYARITTNSESVTFMQADVDRLQIRQGTVLKMHDGRIFRLRVVLAGLDDFTTEFGVSRA